MTAVWYIHGANCTFRSFNYIRSKLPEHDAQEFAYTHDGPVHKVVDRLVAALAAQPEPVILVGHSLGGVIALAATQRSDKIAKVATMAAPFGGSETAALMRWLTPSQLLDDIHPNAPLMCAIRQGRLHGTDAMSIVTTGGRNTMITGDNDGVVTIASQTCIKGPVYLRIPVNHSEVLLCDDVVDLLSGFLFA